MTENSEFCAELYEYKSVNNLNNPFVKKNLKTFEYIILVLFS